MHRTGTVKNLPAVAALLALSAGAVPGGALGAEEEIVTIDSRPGITIGFVLTRPAGAPKAAAILFPGGAGRLKLWKGGPPASKNFLVRSRGLFAERGVLTATIDVPSDRRRKGYNDFRHTADHRKDIAAVLRWLRARTKAPVWLIGTSRGTVSLSHIAGKLPIDGAVFSSSVTEMSNRRPTTALDGRLEDITAPVLLVHHKTDDCSVTPAFGVLSIARRLTRSPRVETRLFSGGTPSDGEACGTTSAHGFGGIETEVVGAIVDWMFANAPH